MKRIEILEFASKHSTDFQQRVDKNTPPNDISKWENLYTLAEKYELDTLDDNVTNEIETEIYNIINNR